MTENIVVHNAVARLFGGHDHLHGQDGAAAQIKEVVFGADLLDPEDASENSAKILLRFAHRRNVGSLLKAGLRKSLLIHLLIDGKRDLIDLHDHRRNHVSRLLGLDILRQRSDIHLGVSGHEGGKVFPASLVIVCLYGHIPDARKAADHALHFLGLDSESADLDLPVPASDEFHISILPVPDDIPGMIHTEFIERARFICFSRFIRPVQIAAADLRSGQAVFSGCARRESVSGLVKNIGVDGPHRFPDRDIRLPLRYREEADAAAVLRRPVAVDDSVGQTGRIHCRQLLTAHHQHPQGLHVRIIQKELDPDLGRQQQRCDPGLVEIVRQSLQIHADLFRDQVYCAAVEQRAEHIRHVHVKSEGSICCDPVLFGIEIIPYAVGVGHHVPVLDLAALGGPGGAGGVQQDEQILRRRPCRLCGFILHSVQLAHRQHGALVLIHQVPQTFLRQKQADTCVLHHEVQTLFRIARIQRLVGQACFDRGQRQDEDVLIPRQEDRHDLLFQAVLSGRLACPLPQLCGQAVGEFVQFPVGICFILVHSGRLVRLRLHVLFEPCHDSVADVVVQIPRPVVAVQHRPLRFFCKTDLRERPACQQPAHGVFDALGQTAHHAGAVQGGIIGHVDTCSIFRSIDEYRHRQFRDILTQ